MKISQLKSVLERIETIIFKLPGGEMVAPHFHITEIAEKTKNYIDCGGTVRKERIISLQLFTATDYDHRLSPNKLLEIIELSEKKFGLADQEVEVEYQGRTIEIYNLDFDGSHFLMIPKKTDCLAKDKCGIPTDKPKTRSIKWKETACASGSGCC